MSNSFLLAVPTNLNISYCNCVSSRALCKSPLWQWSPSNDSLICLQFARILYQHCYVSHSSPLSCPFPGVSLLITSAFYSPLLFPSSCLILRLLSHFQCPFLPCHRSPPSFSFSISVCLLSSAVPQGSLADVIYAISFASVRRESPEANTLHAECSCGRLWASTAWTTCFQHLSMHNAMTMHVTKTLNLHGSAG